MEKILIVEDESIVALELESRLCDLGYSVCGIVVSGDEAIKLTKEHIPNIILMDINIKGPIDGVQTAEKIKEIFDIPIIFLTAFTDPNTLERAKITGPYGYIVKPFEERELHTSIEIAIYKHNMEKKLRDSERRLSITLKSIGDAVIATDNEGKINYMNSAAEELTSINTEDANGKYVLDIFDISDKVTYEIADLDIKKLINTGFSDNFPGNLTISNNSEVKIVESSVSAIKDEKSNIDGIVLVFHDVTEKFKAEAALLESEKKYRKVVENASEIIFALDSTWKYRYVNAATVRISEYSKEELRNMDFSILILPSHRKLCKYKLLRQYLSKEKTSYFEYPIISKNGNIIWLAQSNNLIVENNQLVGFDVIARDITEKKLAEHQLNERNKFIELVLQNIQTGLIVSKIDTGEIIYTNDKLTEILGFAEEPMKNFSQFLNLGIYTELDSKQEIEKNIFEGIKLHDDSKLNYDNIKISTPGGIEKFIICSIIPLYEQGIIISSIEDITFKKRAEEQILKLSRAVEQSPAAVLITAPEGNIVYANPKYIEMTGFTYGELKKMYPCALHSSEFKRDDNHEITKAVKLGQELKGEFMAYKKTGESYWEHVIVSPIKNNNNTIINFLIIKQDISNQKRFENDLIVAKEKAEEMNRLKSVFLANMSHELRTPMVGILGFAQILKEDLKKPDDVEMADLLIKSGKRLLNTLESILEFSQLESKQVYINSVQINVSERIDSLIQNFNDHLNEKKLKLTRKYNRSMKIIADDRLINQVLNNIIDNAIKFTPQGEITIETNEVVENNLSWGIIKISDTGIGISKEKQNIIFDDFRQASEGRRRNFEGNGLGLTVAKKIVQMMNGYITLDSDLGKGSSFSIYLPAVIENDSKHARNVEKSNGKTQGTDNTSMSNLPEILLVEDNEMNKEVVMIYLRKICKVDYAKDGLTAIQMTSQKKYSAVLMDINLGNGFSGVDAMKKIKDINGYNNVPFVALTGYALHDDKEKLLREGCSYYLSKPFMKKDLLDLINEIINVEKKFPVIENN